MAQITQLARNAPDAARGERPVTTYREDLITALLTIWPIVAMFFDGRGHNNETGQESFWSIPHLFLYGGMTAIGVWVGVLVTRYQLAAGADPRKSLIPDLKAIPVGYGVAILGLLTLGLGGPLDFIWHAQYGFEVGVDAIYSPPHLLLFFGGLLVSSTGIRSMWAKNDINLDFKTFVPVLVSTTLFTGVAGFITMYLSAFMTNVSPTSDFVKDYENTALFKDNFNDQSLSLNAGLTSYGDEGWSYYYYAASHGIASEIVTTLVVLGPILLLLRRWRLPLGGVTLIFLGYGLLVNIMTEYRDIILIIPLLLTGVVIDALQNRAKPGERLTLGGIRSVGPAAAATLWISYYAVLALHEGLGWEPTMWVGAIMVGIMTGFGVAFLVAPPAYGPRLVDADSN